jgi:hypothetical protein
MRADVPATPAETLIQALGLVTRTRAEIQDLYNRPLVRITVLPAAPVSAPALAAA